MAGWVLRIEQIAIDEHVEIPTQFEVRVHWIRGAGHKTNSLVFRYNFKLDVRATAFSETLKKSLVHSHELVTAGENQPCVISYAFASTCIAFAVHRVCGKSKESLSFVRDGPSNETRYFPPMGERVVNSLCLEWLGRF